MIERFNTMKRSDKIKFTIFIFLIATMLIATIAITFLNLELNDSFISDDEEALRYIEGDR